MPTSVEACVSAGNQTTHRCQAEVQHLPNSDFMLRTLAIGFVYDERPRSQGPAFITCAPSPPREQVRMVIREAHH
jgi:hypothetical protein